jgi:hypothetical protein
MSTAVVQPAFTADDQDAIVEAAFACRFCLGPPARVAVELDEQGALALCTCSECGELTDVWLSLAQFTLIGRWSYAAGRLRLR